MDINDINLTLDNISLSLDNIYTVEYRLKDNIKDLICVIKELSKQIEVIKSNS